MSACIYYHPEAYTTTGPKLMGRNAAGESFLRGFLAHSGAPEFWVQVEKLDHAKQFALQAQQSGRVEPVKAVTRDNLFALRGPGVTFHPGPAIGGSAWQRAYFGHGSWSLCGITHTTSSAGAMDAITELLAAPVQPWDALICTSNAVKNNVEVILDAQKEYLQTRLGVTRWVQPELPVIPLGIHTKDFEFSEPQRLAAREFLGGDENTLVVLFMGRLSFHAKAHPLAMYQALELAAKQTAKKVLLVECGWYANDHLKDAFLAASQMACPSVRVVTLDGRVSENRQMAWAGSDICCSLSDNIQETFGIVPIEAMAAGLPVIVSDWDGYKDTVRDGVDGFRIPTWMPEGGLARDLALRHALGIDTYDMYCGHTCSLIAVDVQATERAFVSLINSPELRKKMGEAGRQRARALYDWCAIIPQYEALWNEQHQIRRSQSSELKKLQHPWPARMDPFVSFSGYPTRIFYSETVLSLVDQSLDLAIERFRQYQKLLMVNFAKNVIPPESTMIKLMVQLETGPQKIDQLLDGVESTQKPFAIRSLSWLFKLGIVKV